MCGIMAGANSVEIATLILAAGGFVLAGIGLTINYLNRRDRLFSELPRPRTFSVYNTGLPFPHRFNVDLHGGANLGDWGIVRVGLIRPRSRRYSFALVWGGEVQSEWCRSYTYDEPVQSLSLAMSPDCAEAQIVLTCVSLRLPKRNKRMGPLLYTRREHSK